MREIYIDTSTKTPDNKRDGSDFLTPFKSILEALGLTMSKEQYEIRLLREI